jgi:hypothetical protein
VAIFIAVAVSGCQKRFIPNTEIEDNDFNREVINFCERYRHAVEDLNVGLLLSMASPRYFDNAGTPSGDDDCDKEGLEAVLSKRFSVVKAMRFEIKYRNIFEQNSVIYVEYTYTMSFQYTDGDKNRWHNTTADNRLEIERVENGFLFLSGM